MEGKANIIITNSKPQKVSQGCVGNLLNPHKATLFCINL